MKTIHKFPLQITASQVVLMPQGAEIISLQTQSQVPCLWAFVDPESDPEMRILEMYGTGDSIHEAEKRKFLGTFQIKNGESVFHVFEYIRSGDTDTIAKS